MCKSVQALVQGCVVSIKEVIKTRMLKFENINISPVLYPGVDGSMLDSNQFENLSKPIRIQYHAFRISLEIRNPIKWNAQFLCSPPNHYVVKENFKIVPTFWPNIRKRFNESIISKMSPSFLSAFQIGHCFNLHNAIRNGVNWRCKMT